LEYDEGYKSVTFEDGNSYLEVADAEITRHFSEDDEKVDYNAINAGYASLTPLQLDQIAHGCTDRLSRYHR
ncbi:MAG: hypothetical protein IKH73_04120, partial [Erysipelotrichaceae bacterium]|nr:hypothetical protein [Erysipelotrichaceae bacterium]